MTSVRVAVVGGGLAGLLTGVALLDDGVDDVLVVEREPVPGGVARTIRRGGFEVEPAVGTLLRPHPLLASLDCELVPAHDAAVRHVFTRGRLVPLPASPMALLAPVLPWWAKLRALAEVGVRRRAAGPDETLDEFMTRRFGRRAGRAIAWLAASGVFAGDPGRLSARAAFPALPALEADAGSVIRGAVRRRRAASSGQARPAPLVPVGGMSALADAAAARLGPRFRAAAAVDSVRHEDGGWVLEGDERITAAEVVLACGPPAAARLVDADLGAVLGQAVAAPVVVLGLGGRGAAPPGFGALVGRDAGMVSRGVLFESSYAPGRAPAGQVLLRVIAGGATLPDVAGWHDQRLTEVVGGEAARIVGGEPSWEFTEVVRHPVGIPQYVVGHGDWLAELDRKLADRPGLHVTGWGYRGVGVNHVAADAAATAARIAGQEPAG